MRHPVTTNPHGVAAFRATQQAELLAKLLQDTFRSYVSHSTRIQRIVATVEENLLLGDVDAALEGIGNILVSDRAIRKRRSRRSAVSTRLGWLLHYCKDALDQIDLV